MTSPAAEAVSPEASGSAGHAALWLTDLSLVLMALVWGVNYSVVKYGTMLLAPLAYNGVRIALAATTLAGLAAYRRRPAISRRDTLVLLSLGMLGNGLYQVLFIEGLALTRAGDAALVVSASPALMAIVGRMYGIERVSRRGIAGIVLSLTGMVCVVLGGAEASARGASISGDLLVLAGSLCWAVYTVLLTPYTRRVDGVTLSAYTMFGGLIVILIAAFPALAHTTWTLVPFRAWGAIAYSGFGALVIAYLFWYRGVRLLGPTRTAMYSNLQPVFALFVAWGMLAETPTMWQIVGAASITAGLVLTRS